MHEETKQVPRDSTLLPSFAFLIKPNETYFHPPEFNSLDRDPNNYWLFSLIPDGFDLRLKQVTMRKNNVISEKMISYDEIFNSLRKNKITGAPSKDVVAYRLLGDAIFFHRESFIQKILLKNNIQHIKSTERDFAFYSNLRSHSKRYPMLVFFEECHWGLMWRAITSEYKGQLNRIHIDTKLMRVSWNDEEGIRRAIGRLLDTTRHKELEIQVILGR